MKIGKHEKLENVKRPRSGECFHGECWYRCPKCNGAFEYWDAIYERKGITHIKNKIYLHECGQLIDMS